METFNFARQQTSRDQFTLGENGRLLLETEDFLQANEEKNITTIPDHVRKPKQT